MNTPPKLTDEQISDLWNKPGNSGNDFARAVESARDQQWLDMLAAAPGVEQIMELARVVQDEAWNDGKLGDTYESERTTAAVAALRTAVEQALADQCTQLVLERDELMKQVQRYEKHGVTCQTYRHHVAGCGECNNEAPQPPQQPAEWVGLTEADKMMLLPVVRLRGEDPKPLVWLTRNDAFAYADAIDTKLREKNTENKQ